MTLSGWKCGSYLCAPNKSLEYLTHPRNTSTLGGKKLWIEVNYHRQKNDKAANLECQFEEEAAIHPM